MPIAINLSKSEPDERLLVDFLHAKLAYPLSRADDFNTLDDEFSTALVHLVGIPPRYYYSGCCNCVYLRVRPRAF